MTSDGLTARLRPQVDLAEMKALVGGPATFSDWLSVDQVMISGFADVTHDDAFIHTDPERAAKTRFKGTIAHGLLTLSLLPIMLRTATPELIGAAMGVNYGFDRVRFMKPVPVGARVRGKFLFVAMVEDKPGFYKLSYDAWVMIENQEKPAAMARWLLGCWVKTESGS
jgi:acyl dehydratase